MRGTTRVRLLGAFTFVRDLQERERKRLLAEAVQIKGLMPLLMKKRNGQRWTREDKAELRVYLRRLSALSPYLVVVVLPGAPLTIPLLAWWLDRRRLLRKNGPHDTVPAKPPSQ
ncbi:MAG: hypothetical protein EPO02_10740 [Nitrospirae bacterium]|nr:MAG: hypothetical protein EPO02_10740 [Nitrospirota bacterium]